MSARSAPRLAQSALATSRLARISRPVVATAAPAAACSSSSSSSSRFASTSSAAITPDPVAAAPTAHAGRVFPARKAFLFAYYTHLLQRSRLVLVFNHDNLSVADLSRVRRALKAVRVPPAPFDPADPDLASSDDPAAAAALPEAAKFEVVRKGILAPVTRSTTASLEPYLAGPAALLTCPSLSPTYVAQLLAAVQRALKQSRRADPNAKQPVLELRAGVLEGSRLVGVEQIEAVSRLPELDVLRAQVVGLLEGQGRSLVGLLGQAAGGQLVRTMAGLEEQLKQGEGEASA